MRQDTNKQVVNCRMLVKSYEAFSAAFVEVYYRDGSYWRGLVTAKQWSDLQARMEATKAQAKKDNDASWSEYAQKMRRVCQPPSTRNVVVRTDLYCQYSASPEATFDRIVSWKRGYLGREGVFVEAILCSGGYWAGWITDERWEEVKQEEFERGLAELGA